MDTFGGLGVMLIAVFELVGIMWVYGVNNFCDNVRFMNGFKPGIVFKVCWVFIAPIMLAVSLLECPCEKSLANSLREAPLILKKNRSPSYIAVVL